LSTDVDRCGKLKMLFDVFDTDCDTVLEDHQIKMMFSNICRNRDLFQGNALIKHEGGQVFLEQLSEQEGLRNYECLRWRLHRGGNYEDVITSLLPFPPLIRWALDPIAVQIEDSLPRAMTPQRSQRQLAEMLKSHPTSQLADTFSSASKKGAAQDGHRKSVMHRQALPPSKSCPTLGQAKWPPMVPGGSWQDSSRPQTTELRANLTDGFQKRLRRLGHQRGIQLADAEDPKNPRPPSMEDSRPSTTVGKRGPGLLPSLGSKVNPGRKGSSSQGNLQRVSTAPMGQNMARLLTGTASSDHSKLDTLPIANPHMALKWGREGSDRFKLLVDAQSVSDKDPKTCHCHNTSLGTLDAFCYSCSCCEGQHALNPKEKTANTIDEADETQEDY